MRLYNSAQFFMGLYMTDKKIQPSDFETIRYKDKYRIESTRLKGYDYSSNGAYFVTICVLNHKCAFGNIKDGKVNLSALGKSAEECWLAIPEHFPFVELDKFVVMPNHIHGIIVILKPDFYDVETQNLASVPVTNHHTETQNVASLHGRFGPQSQNLASIIRGFKIGVTKFAGNNNIPFKWQPRFHDHIIRNENEFANIQLYIMHNPLNWESDDYFSIEKEPHRE